jgi:hypothetical protein
MERFPAHDAEAMALQQYRGAHEQQRPHYPYRCRNKHRRRSDARAPMDARCSSASQNGKCTHPAAGTACQGHATAQQHTCLRNKGSFKGLAAASQPAAAPQQYRRLAHKASPFSSHRQTDTCMHACMLAHSTGRQHRVSCAPAWHTPSDSITCAPAKHC